MSAPDRRPGAAPPSEPAPRGITDLNEKVAHLAATSLLGNLAREKLLPLAPVFETAHYPAGAEIARQGEVDSSLRVLVSGTVSLQHERGDGAKEHRGLRGYGSCLGLRSLFTGAPRQTTALALEPVTLIYMDGEVLWEILRTDAEMLDHLVLPDDIRQRLRVPRASDGGRGEQEVARFRRHWLTVVPKLILFPGLIFTLMGLLVLPISQTGASPASMLLLAVFNIMVTLAVAAWIFADWWRDYLSVTDRRVMHVEETPLIDARRSAAQLERVQDVRFVQPGIPSRIFNYGNLSIQTAGSKTAVEFKTVARPAEARNRIFEQVERAREMARSERQAVIARKILAAMGKAPMAEPDEELMAASVEDEAWTPLQVFGLIAGYFFPRTRIEDPDGTITWRKHWWLLLVATWLPALLLTLLVSSVAWIELGFSPLPADALAGSGAAILGAGIILLLWLWWQFEDWRNDLYVLTDELIIDIERKPLGFFSEQRQAPLSQVQDVRFTIPNPWASILNYGDLLIETAAETGGFTFDFIYHPESVQEEIFFRMEQRRAALQREEQERRDDELIRWISAYHQAMTFGSGQQGPPATFSD